MAKQGQRYNPKTKTGWKWENGITVYYKKGKKLSNTRQLFSLGKEIFDPLWSGAKTIRDKLRISPKSETGESVFEYNKRIDKAQDEFDDSEDVAAYQKYEKGANKHNELVKKLGDLRIKNQETSVGPPEKSFQYGGGSGSRKVDGKALMDQLRSERSDNMQPSTVHTRHYETGERLGVMTRSQRSAYDKKAAGRTFESEVAKYEKSSGHGKSHKRETLYKRKNKKKLSIDD